MREIHKEREGERVIEREGERAYGRNIANNTTLCL